MIKEIQELSEEFKRSVIEEVNCGAITKEAARRLYGIKGKSSILNWQRNYERYGKCSLNLHFDPLPLKTNKPVQSDTAHEALKARIKVLERQLEDEQLRAEAYSRMIDIAESKLKVPIRKKSGTR